TSSMFFIDSVATYLSINITHMLQRTFITLNFISFVGSTSSSIHRYFHLRNSTYPLSDISIPCFDQTNPAQNPAHDLHSSSTHGSTKRGRVRSHGPFRYISLIHYHFVIQR